ncbi:unannotated protein [freshwater metagenome]|uniref:Unannotated protein n=1 Tax=freshwater metagenome TaxID=449393 RepID=A0A6J6AEQ3_9ZZZZ
MLEDPVYPRPQAEIALLPKLLAGVVPDPYIPHKELEAK